MNDIIGGVIPKEYISPIEKGMRESAEAGVIAGYPVTDILVRLYDGSFHEVNSNEMAFKIAGSMAFKDGVHKGTAGASGTDHESCVMDPEEYLGEIMGS